MYLFWCVFVWFIFSWFCLSHGGFSIVILLISALEITHCIIILVRALNSIASCFNNVFQLDNG